MSGDEIAAGGLPEAAPQPDPADIVSRLLNEALLLDTLGPSFRTDAAEQAAAYRHAARLVAAEGWAAAGGPEPGSREAAMAPVADGVWCDPEIAPLVKALNKGGVATVASCSGHGHRPGNIILADGRELFIAADWDEARLIDQAFPVDINGETRVRHHRIVCRGCGAAWTATEIVDGEFSETLPGACGCRCAEGDPNYERWVEVAATGGPEPQPEPATSASSDATPEVNENDPANMVYRDPVRALLVLATTIALNAGYDEIGTDRGVVIEASRLRSWSDTINIGASSLAGGVALPEPPDTPEAKR